jgi:predicted RND superfamily exporter protein
VRRENGVRLLSVTGDISEDDPARAEEITRALSEAILPELSDRFGVGFKMAGLAEQEENFLSDALFGFGACLVGIFLTLAWVFSSWTRPLLIMAVIPFGLIGTIYGHAAWGLPLSMFTVIGLIGMSGIIINDSIVLVTTVDEYSKERGLFPAIIDGATDRLRPVLLTTLTTVIGLMPLLYEPSGQAQFLKPTVITLIYGLGFGVVLVLLVVPALLAMQQDVRRQFQAMRRAFGGAKRLNVVTVVTIVAALGLAGLFAATVGHIIVAGAPWPLMAQGVPFLTGLTTPWLGLLGFLAMSAVWLCAVFLIAVIAYAVAGSRRGLRART